MGLDQYRGIASLHGERSHLCPYDGFCRTSPRQIWSAKSGLSGWSAIRIRTHCLLLDSKPYHDDPHLWRNWRYGDWFRLFGSDPLCHQMVRFQEKGTHLRDCSIGRRPLARIYCAPHQHALQNLRAGTDLPLSGHLCTGCDLSSLAAPPQPLPLRSSRSGLLKKRRSDHHSDRLKTGRIEPKRRLHLARDGSDALLLSSLVCLPDECCCRTDADWSHGQHCRRTSQLESRIPAGCDPSRFQLLWPHHRRPSLRQSRPNPCPAVSLPDPGR